MFDLKDAPVAFSDSPNEILCHVYKIVGELVLIYHI